MLHVIDRVATSGPRQWRYEVWSPQGKVVRSGHSRSNVIANIKASFWTGYEGYRAEARSKAAGQEFEAVERTGPRRPPRPTTHDPLRPMHPFDQDA